MPNFRERSRIVIDRLLDIVGLTPPGFENQAPYRFGNELGRVLAHLVAQDGSRSRLVKLDANGRLEAKVYGSRNLPIGQLASGRVIFDDYYVLGQIIKAAPAGVKTVGGIIGTITADKYKSQDLAIARVIDLDTAADRMIAIRGRFGGTENYSGVQTSTDGSIPVTDIGYVSETCPLVCRCDLRYLIFFQTTNDGWISLRAWDL